MKVSEIIEHLRGSGYEKHADIIESQAERCVGFNMIPTDESELPLGCSKSGGLPDLPPDYRWPSYRGRPLDFILQINLEDVSGFPSCQDLPERGLISVFYNAVDQPLGLDPMDRRQWKIHYIRQPERGLKRLALPEGAVFWQFRSCALAFHEAFSFGWADMPVVALNLDEGQAKEFRQFTSSLPINDPHKILSPITGVRCAHEHLGRVCQWTSNGLYSGERPRPVFDVERAKELEPGTKDWRPLLLLSSDEAAAMKWGKRGQICFWIRDEDLHQRDFSDVWVLREFA